MTEDTLDPILYSQFAEDGSVECRVLPHMNCRSSFVETTLREDLTAIPGVGRRKEAALKNAGYTTMLDLMNATQQGLTEVSGIGNALAARIKADVMSRQEWGEFALPNQEQAMPSPVEMAEVIRDLKEHAMEAQKLTCNSCGEIVIKGNHVDGDYGEVYCSMVCLNETYTEQ